MYEPICDHTLRQGDVLRGLPFTYFLRSSADVCTADGDERKADLLSDKLTDVAARVGVVYSAGMVMSQDCDIANPQKADFVLVARVHPIGERLPEYDQCSTETKRAKWLRERLLTTGPYADFFYIMPCAEGGIPRSVAEFPDLQAFHRDDFPGLVARRCLRLAPDAKQFLQARLAHFFGRLAVHEECFLTQAERNVLGISSQQAPPGVAAIHSEP